MAVCDAWSDPATVLPSVSVFVCAAHKCTCIVGSGSMLWSFALDKTCFRVIHLAQGFYVCMWHSYNICSWDLASLSLVCMYLLVQRETMGFS